MAAFERENIPTKRLTDATVAARLKKTAMADLIRRAILEEVTLDNGRHLYHLAKQSKVGH
jgi:hypothetical protein